MRSRMLERRYIRLALIIYHVIAIEKSFSLMMPSVSESGLGRSFSHRRTSQRRRKLVTVGEELSWSWSLPLSEFQNNASEHKIDYQSDESMYGRGEMHLSAMLEEKNIVAYQTGTWEVDGVEVGDGTPPSMEFCAVETMQVVWTHNCEHGFVRGLAVTIDAKTGDVTVNSPLEFIDFGPEQLVARLPVHWINEEEAKLLVDFPTELQKTSLLE